NEAIAVHHLDGGGCPQRANLGNIEQVRAVEHEEGADALAAAHEGVAHGLDHAPLRAIDQRDEAIKSAVDRIRSLAESRFQALHVNDSIDLGGFRGDATVAELHDLLDLQLRFAQLGFAVTLEIDAALIGIDRIVELAVALLE